MIPRELWPHFSEGNAITLLETGAEFFPALALAIDHARKEVFLETYIFRHDRIGELITDALVRAAERGVVVSLLVDGFGSRDFVASHMNLLVDKGVRMLVYRREVGRLLLRRHRLRRLHRKLATIDGRIAFVGGINIIDDHNTALPDHPRHDYAIRIEGPLLQPIHDSARRLWELVAWASFRQRLRLKDTLEPRTDAAGKISAAFVIRDNLRHRRDIETAYLDAIANATDEIVIANAYFLPGRRVRKALTGAADRGVRVIILLQGRVEYALQHYATKALYPALLRHGVRIFEYHRSFLHAKVAVIDGHWATVGSSNFDPFSLLLAREGNVIIRDDGFARRLRERLDHAISTGATELEPSRWRHKSLFKRGLHWIAYALVRFAVGLSGYGGDRDTAER
ncbi:cardiolipin synthase ClsB [Denitromonas halophila]|uniref:Cardiolipin synthase B n=1 Tax=Denitromonas halophila TaxID=1629404 RepID=A0A557QIH0_9RHOO|nr:cardiolipin synthase ClsB [Denitromonas halophila]TVO52703.1 cardiolipin synthase ClsB [Denitromonas halophila]